jgi:hypothetical protein
MSLGTFIVCGVAFAAGVVVGVVLGEKGIVTTSGLEQGGRYIMDTTKSVVNKVQDQIKPAPAA